MTPLYFHDLYCPDAGFGCRRSNMAKVDTCAFYAGVQSLVKTERDQCSARVEKVSEGPKQGLAKCQKCRKDGLSSSFEIEFSEAQETVLVCEPCYIQWECMTRDWLSTLRHYQRSEKR